MTNSSYIYTYGQREREERWDDIPKFLVQLAIVCVLLRTELAGAQLPSKQPATRYIHILIQFLYNTRAYIYFNATENVCGVELISPSHLQFRRMPARDICVI